MTKAVLPIQQGFDYQSRLFWSKVCELFLPFTKTARVEYEVNDLKSFDDVIVSYSEPIPFFDGKFKTKDYFQAKFHSHNTAPIRHSSLIDPAFIGATADSFLQKLHNAHQRATAADEIYGFNLFSPSGIHPDDELSPVWNNFDGRLNIERLFAGTTNKSPLWNLRQLWAKHLGVSEDELRALISVMQIHQGPNMQMLREQLNKDLVLAGLAPVDGNKLTFAYDDLVRKLHAAGTSMSFDRAQMEAIARAEGLWIGNSQGYPSEKTIGIRSFLRFAEEMPNLTFDMLALDTYFSGRSLTSSWNDTIRPEVSAFIKKHESYGETVFVLLETHISISFAAGMSIDPKSSTKFIPIQKNEFRQPEIWSVSGNTVGGDNWSVDELAAKTESSQLAVAVAVTHPVIIDVQDFVDRELDGIPCVAFTIRPNPGFTSVRDGNHAYTLAMEMAQILNRVVKEGGITGIHIFAAAPVGFMFYLGKLLRLPASCPITVYEYDFDAREKGAYRKAITFNGNENRER